MRYEVYRHLQVEKVASFPTQDEAIEYATSLMDAWLYVVDTETGLVVWEDTDESHYP